MMQEFPTDKVEVTVLRVVSDLKRSRHFYKDVLGAQEFREYGGSSTVLKFAGMWLLLVTGGGPTLTSDVVSHELTIRVPDCRAAYRILKARGAVFLTPPVEYDWEIRCFFRDPDGHLLEISESKAR